MYDWIFFDLDGTLTDPAEGITNSVMYALQKKGISVTDRQSLYPFIGPPLAASFTKYFGFSEVEAQECVSLYREYFRDRGIFENKVYDGVKELLCSLREKGKHIALATSKPEGFAGQILDHFGLSEYFDLVAGATLDGSRVKKGDVIAYAMKSLNLTDSARVLMVGDRMHDVEGARENGMDSLGVLYGYGSRKELEDAGANYMAKTVSDVLEYIAGR